MKTKQKEGRRKGEKEVWADRSTERRKKAGWRMNGQTQKAMIKKKKKIPMPTSS